MSLIDRYLSLTFATPDQLSLVAIAALSIAWDVVEDDPKYTVFGSLCAHNYFYYKLLKELEQNSPSILQSSFTDNLNIMGKIEEMKEKMLKALEYNTSQPTVIEFVWILSKKYLNTGIDVHWKLASSVAERVISDWPYFLRYPPSIIAAAAVVYCKSTDGLTIWLEQDLEELSGGHVDELKKCYEEIYCLVQRGKEPQT